MEIAELYELFRRWCEQADGELVIASDGSGSIRMANLEEPVLSWSTMAYGCQTLMEELTGDFPATTAFCRRHQVEPCSQTAGDFKLPTRKPGCKCTFTPGSRVCEVCSQI